MICDECKGSKVYIGLKHTEPCKKCCGLGELPVKIRSVLRQMEGRAQRSREIECDQPAGGPPLSVFTYDDMRLMGEPIHNGDQVHLDAAFETLNHIAEATALTRSAKLTPAEAARFMDEFYHPQFALFKRWSKELKPGTFPD